MTDFNASANIGAGHPKEERLKPIEIDGWTLTSERLRRLRSIKIALDSILIQVTHGMELVDLLLEEELGSEIVYSGVDKLMELGFEEQDAHYWMHRSHKVAVSIPYSPYLNDEERAKDNKFFISYNRAPFPLIDETPASRDWVILDRDTFGYTNFTQVYIRLVELLKEV